MPSAPVQAVPARTSPVAVKQSRTYSGSVSTLIAAPYRVACTVSLGGHAYPLWFESDEPLTLNGNALTAFRLLPAMLAGEDVTIEGADTLLIENLPEIAAIYRRFVPQSRDIRFDFLQPQRTSRSSTRTAAFFSGGIDSLYVLASRMQSITDLVMVHGFDIPYRDELSFAAARANAEAVALAHGKRLIVVRTNLREDDGAIFGQTGATWAMYHGAAIAGVAHLLGPRRVLIGSSYDYATIHPWGSHPLLDPLWSTGATSFEHVGTALRRVDKVAEIARLHPTLLDDLRVCWQPNAAGTNCGTCEKCMRSIANLAAVGATERCRTLPRELSPDVIRRLPLTRGAALFWAEMEDAPRLSPAVRAAIRATLHNERFGLTPWNGTLKSGLLRLRDYGRALTAPLHAL
jgi:bacterioferritin-associated ferredoxin